ncbi:MAG: hypothetical protein ABEK01_04895 [Candidatus Nanohaloarchaea archaeon]
MSTAAKVELYVAKRPYIKEALAEGIVNYSALARKISREEDLGSIDAVKAALSRYQDHVSDKREERKKEVSEVLESTGVEVRDGVTAEKSGSRNDDSVVAARTASGYTNVVPGGDRSLVSLESPEKLEETPGVLEFVLSSLAAEGINVDHLISCRKDTHLVVDRSDAPEVLELLQERMV